MNKEQLEKATGIFAQIKVLDSQIIEIDRFAMMVANDEIKAHFELKVENVGKKKEESEKVSFDEDGSLIGQQISMMRRMLMESPIGCGIPPHFGKPAKSAHDHSFTAELTESATLQILGVLLGEKQTKRQSLICELLSLGVKF